MYKMKDMKKQIILMSLLLGLTFGACEDNKEQYLDQYSTITYFRNSGVDELTLYKTGVDTDYSIIINKAGSNLNTATSVNMLVMNEIELKYYNNRNSTNYEILPTDCYQINGETALNFEPGETSKKIGVVFKTNTIDELMTAHRNQEYVLPLQLVESADSINSQKKMLLIQPKVLIPTISFRKEGMEEIVYGGDGTDVFTYSYIVGMSLKNQWTFDCTIDIDEEALEAYNEKNGTDYELLSKDVYEMPTTLTFVSGANDIQLNVKIDYSKLICGTYALPFKLLSVSNANFVVDETPCILGIIYKAPRVDLTVDMLYCNRPQSGSEGNLANLLDDNVKTYFHSSYDAVDRIFDHYLQIDLKEPVRAFQYSYTTRDSNGNGNPIGTVVKVSEDGVNFIEVAHITQGLPTDKTAEYLSPILKSDTPVRYIRLENDGALNGRPYFVFSEFSFYGK